MIKYSIKKNGGLIYMKLVVVFGLLTFVGCSTTRVVKIQPGVGGEIAVNQGMFGGDAKEMARAQMRENCGNKKAEVVEEGEAVIGKSGSGSSRNEGFFKSESYDETQKTEWRLKYKCGDAGKGTPAAPPAAKKKK